MAMCDPWDSLEELFDVAVSRDDGSQPPLSLKNRSQRELFHPVPISICQHNIYDADPFAAELKSDAVYMLRFPDTVRAVLKSIDVTPAVLGEMVECSAPTATNSIYEQYFPVNTPWFETLFTAAPSFGLKELKEQLYLCNVNSYNFENAYSIVNTHTKDIDPLFDETTFVALTRDEIEQIASLHEQCCRGRDLQSISAELQALAEGLEERLQEATEQIPGRTFFFKLNTRSAKDSTFYKDQKTRLQLVERSIRSDGDLSDSDAERLREARESFLRPCEARVEKAALDVIHGLVGSERTSLDCKAWMEWRVADKPPLQIVCQSWSEFIPEMEFRCFVFQRELTAMNQLCWSTHVEALRSESMRERISQSIQHVYDAIRDVVPWNDYIFDVIYHEKEDRSTIVEFNPFGPHSCTGSQLFSWELDRNILGRNSVRSPKLRVLPPGMDVFAQFDLYVAKKLWNPTPAFEQELARTVKACPCCPRKKPPITPQ